MARPQGFSEPLSTQIAAGGPQVGEVIPFPSWRRARDKACAALLAGETLLLVTGPAGTGKTMLVQDIARVLRFTGREVASRIAGLPGEAGRVASGTPSAVLIDEADRLSDAELRAVRGSARSPVLLAGLDSLADRCPAGPRISLGPLGASEARIFIELWLAQAGHDPTRLEEAAVLRTIELSGGVPRLLAALLGTSIWLAGASGSAQVSAQRVEQAASLRDCLVNGAGEADDAEEESEAELQPGRGRRRARAFVLTGLALGIVGCAGVAAARYWPMPASLRALVDAHLPRAWVGNLPSGAPAAVQAAVSPIAPAAAAPAPDVPPNPVEPARLADPEPRPADPPPRETEPSAVAPASAAVAPPAPDVTPAAPSSSPSENASPEPEKAQPAAPARIAIASAQPAPDTLPPALMELLVRRGNEMFALGDYSAARLLFGRAAAAGSAAAMLAMGRTYDPAFLDGGGSQTAPDPAAAAQWYRLAMTAGNSEAGGLLQRVERQVAK